MSRYRAADQQGFTLVELILVIVIIGIIAVGSTQFIVNSAKGLNDVTRRDALANSLRISLGKIERQLNNSLSYSVRIKRKGDNQCIEMLPIKSRAFYAKAPIDTSGFNLLAIALNQPVIGLRAVIPSTAVNDYYANSLDTNLGIVSSHIKNQSSTEHNNVSQLDLYSAHQFSHSSAQRALYFVEQPLSYCIEKGNLVQYKKYGYHQQQQLSAQLPQQEPQRTLLVKDLLALSKFRYNTQTQTVDIVLQMGDAVENLLINHRLWLNNE